MTVDELLAKLDAEYDKLEAGKPNHYMKIGKHYKVSGEEYWETKDAVQQMDWDIERQTTIRNLQKLIRMEVER